MAVYGKLIREIKLTTIPKAEGGRGEMGESKKVKTTYA